MCMYERRVGTSFGSVVYFHIGASITFIITSAFILKSKINESFNVNSTSIFMKNENKTMEMNLFIMCI